MYRLILGLGRKLTTRMPPDSPANIVKFIRALSSVRKISGWVPGFRIGINTLIAMSVGDMIKLVNVSEHLLQKASSRSVTHSKSSIRHNFPTNRDILTTDIPPLEHTLTLDSDCFFQTKIQHWELALPSFDGKSGKLIRERCGLVSCMLCRCVLDLFADFSHPARVGGEVAEKPAGVDAAVYDAGEESADDELMAIRDLL